MGNREALLKSHEAGTLLKTIYDCSVRSRTDLSDLVLTLVGLHNEELVDIVQSFEALTNEGEQEFDFFRTRYVFEKVLPDLDAPVRHVMKCVLHLYHAAGMDLAASSIIDAFVDFCLKDPARPQNALVEIEADPESFAEMLPSVLIAGSRIDSVRMFTEAIRLCGDSRIDLRRHASFALGKLKLPDRDQPVSLAFQALEGIARTETDDRLLAGVIDSVSRLVATQTEKASDAASIMRTALEKGGEYTLHSAAAIFGLKSKGVPTPVVDELLKQLVRTESKNKESLKYIDYGIAHLLKTADSDKAIRFLETFLLGKGSEIGIDEFGSTVAEIRANMQLLNRVMTRWFLTGERTLCRFIQTVCETHDGHNLLPEVDPHEIMSSEARFILFLARKAIGFLFSRPVSACSVMVSLIEYTDDSEVLGELGRLLNDPLLMNYTGSAFDYVSRRAESTSGITRQILDGALAKINEYLDDLRSVGHLPALCPTQSQREASQRHFSRLMAESWKQAQRESVFLSLVSKSVLLYGRKSVNYVSPEGGEQRRMESSLGSFSTEIESVRMHFIDPIGLDHTLRVFRNERVVS